MKNKQYSQIVRTAFDYGITNIGQLSKEELRDLNNAVKDGYLKKIKDYHFPVIKDRYVLNWERFV